ncbi:MAG TPA: YkgJ family cysteine cluster protein [Pirellulales bacterium]|nr:YkgJ family cysteine cluster protein [Pirellulales bacterium]
MGQDDVHWLRKVLQVSAGDRTGEETRKAGKYMISCDDCGACCLHMGIPPFDDRQSDLEFDILPPDLQQEIVETMEQAGWAFKPCAWFDEATKRCKHYELRPAICAGFELGNPICVDDRRIAGIQQETV